MIPHQHPWAFRNNKNTDKDSDLRFLSLTNIGNNRFRYKFEGKLLYTRLYTVL